MSQLVRLTDLSLAKNKISEIQNDALAPLTGLLMLDLHQNQLTNFESVPNAPKLDQILLAFNQLSSISNLERSPNLSVLDLHNNKMEKLPDTVCHLYHLKTLKISNNSLSDINPKLALIDSLVRISIEGNPLKSFKPAMRQANAKELKEFLQMKLKDEEIRAFD